MDLSTPSLLTLSLGMAFRFQDKQLGYVDIENEKGQCQLPISFDRKLNLVEYERDIFITGFYVDISSEAFNLKNVGLIDGVRNHWKILPYYVLYCMPPEDLANPGKPMFNWRDINHVMYPRRLRDIFAFGRNHGKLIKVKPITDEALIGLGLRKLPPGSK